MPDLFNPLPAGKLPLLMLERLLARFESRDPRLIVGPQAGEDAAVIDMGDRCLVAKTDPITFATSEIGWYAVNVNANDVAAMGARPRWFMATVLLPAGKASEAMAEEILGQVADACRSLDITLAGGHTEITVDLGRPIVCGTMLGEAPAERIIRTAGALPGDAILLVKPAPIEGTALIALERADVLAGLGYSAASIGVAQRYLHDPGISVVAPALLLAEAGGVHAMHDPTEGGVVTGLLEISRAAGVGLEIDLDAIPIPALSASLCREFGLDPLGTIASGSLLVAASESRAVGLQAILARAGYPSARIGRALPPEAGLSATHSGLPVPWPVFPVDEITRLFG